MALICVQIITEVPGNMRSWKRRVLNKEAKVREEAFNVKLNSLICLKTSFIMPTSVAKILNSIIKQTEQTCTIMEISERQRAHYLGYK